MSHDRHVRSHSSCSLPPLCFVNAAWGYMHICGGGDDVCKHGFVYVRGGDWLYACAL
jgi:hypothetical protein